MPNPVDTAIQGLADHLTATIPAITWTRELLDMDQAAQAGLPRGCVVCSTLRWPQDEGETAFTVAEIGVLLYLDAPRRADVDRVTLEAVQHFLDALKEWRPADSTALEVESADLDQDDNAREDQSITCGVYVKLSLTL